MASYFIFPFGFGRTTILVSKQHRQDSYYLISFNMRPIYAMCVYTDNAVFTAGALDLLLAAAITTAIVAPPPLIFRPNTKKKVI